VETERAWRVTIAEIKERGYNLDFKNPHTVVPDEGDPVELLAELEDAETKAAALRGELKAILEEALLR
jgi:type I restriction enzyme M protein